MVHRHGTDAPDTLNGSSHDDELYGWATGHSFTSEVPGDDDLIQGHRGDDKIDGGSGADLVKGGPGDDHLLGGYDVDTLFGGGGDDYFSGSRNDVHYGGAGADRFEVYGANTYVYAGSGDDSVHLYGSDLPIAVNAGEGRDGLKIHGFASDSIVVDMSGPKTLFNGVTLAGLEYVYVEGSRFADSVIGGDLGDTFDGFEGADFLDGRGGNDIFFYDSGDGFDSIFGGAGIDQLVVSYETANEALFLILQSEFIFYGVDGGSVSGIERLIVDGSRFADRVTGGDLADTIYGYRGNDTLRGGGGNDVLYISGGESLMNGGSGSDSVYGGHGGDILEGGGGKHDALYGNNGDDFLTVGAESGKMFGGSGSDTLMGGKGDDTLQGGGGGVDLLYGGGGSDVFEFRTAPVADQWARIMNFSTGNDLLLLASSAFAALPDGVLGAEAFVEGTRALDADDHVIYDQATGVIRYDPDGAGGEVSMTFARVAPGLNLSAEDFFIL